MENKEIYYIEESQTWVCPIGGRWKVICVGGGASGGAIFIPSSGTTTIHLATAGGTTSFGDVLSAPGGISAQEAVDSKSIGGYGGFNGITYGGVPSSSIDCPSTGNATLATYYNVNCVPTAALGWGAGGGGSSSSTQHKLFPGRAGEIRTTIVNIDEDENVPCTVGAGGTAPKASDAAMANGAEGVIILQYVGV